MTARKPITIFEVYDRFVKGEKVDESDWDYMTIPMNATALKEKYKLDFGDKFIPEDRATKDALFNAGLEMLVTTGFYCPDLKRKLTITEDEVWEGIEKAPKRLTLGTGRDSCDFAPRRGNEARKPVIQGGPTGAPLSEQYFIPIMQSYAQEAIVDHLVNGVMATIEGHDAKCGTPYEIRATMAELRATREARVRAGRPNMGV